MLEEKNEAALSSRGLIAAYARSAARIRNEIKKDGLVIGGIKMVEHSTIMTELEVIEKIEKNY